MTYLRSLLVFVIVEVPTYHKLLNPTLVALHRLGGIASIAELRDEVVEDLRLPQEIIEQPHSSKTNRIELEYRLAWARTYLKKYGAMVRYVRDQSRSEREGRTKPEEIDDVQAVLETEEETASWRETLMATLLDVPPDAMERLCQRLLRESAFIQVEVTGRSGDRGIDGHGVAGQVACLVSQLSFNASVTEILSLQA